jgi:hypothetical protein
VVFPKASAKTKRYRPKFSRCLSNENQSVFPQQSKQYTNINNFKLTDTTVSSTNSSFTDYLGNNPACASQCLQRSYCNTPSFLLFLQVYGLRLATWSISDYFLKSLDEHQPDAKPLPTHDSTTQKKQRHRSMP